MTQALGPLLPWCQHSIPLLLLLLLYQQQFCGDRPEGVSASLPMQTGSAFALADYSEGVRFRSEVPVT